jgi:hypothetical protein
MTVSLRPKLCHLMKDKEIKSSIDETQMFTAGV